MVAGSEAVIHFAHANGIPSGSYTPVFERLEACRVYNLPMFGHNTAFPVDDNWHTLGDELIAYLEATVGHKVIGVGHSMGAIITFLAAMKRPDLFEGILMLDPPVICGRMAFIFRVVKLLGQADRVTPAARTMKRRQLWDDYESARTYFSSKAIYSKFHKDCLDSLLVHALEGGPSGLQLAFDVGVEAAIFRTTPHDLRAYTNPLSVPGKIVFSKTSKASFARYNYLFARRHLMDVSVTTGSHMYPLESPAKTARIITRYVAEIIGRREHKRLSQ